MKRLHPRAILALLFLAAACGDDGSGPTEPPIENDAPIADAGGDQEVVVGATVTLDGSGSSDPDGDAITYAWSLVSTPSGSAATLSGATASAPSFVADVAGTYTVELSVSDGAASDADTVSVTAADAKLELGGTIGADSTLPDLGVPYRVTAPLVVEATLTLEPGVVLVFGAGAGLTVNAGGSLVAVGTATDTIRFVGADEAEVTVEPGAYLEFAEAATFTVESGGSLYAVGTAEDTIRFVGAEASPGYWSGIRVLTNSDSNVLTYVDIGHGGRVDQGTVTVGAAAKLTVTNSHVHDSRTYGIYANTGAVVTLTDNTYANNASGDTNVP